MAKSNYDRPYKWRPKGKPLPPGGKEYFAQLINAKEEPQKHSMPICHLHIKGLAQSISRREMTEAVVVLVEPGLADPESLSTNIFCCFLCQREGE